MNTQEIRSLLLDLVRNNAAHIVDYSGWSTEEDIKETSDLDPNHLAYLEDDYKKTVKWDVRNFTLSIAENDTGDGDGAERFLVMKIKNNTDGTEFYARLSGWRSSHDVDQWQDDITVVEPRQVQVTKWFAVGAP